MLLLERIAPARAANQRILVVNGHPDPRPSRFCSALCSAYENGAHQAGRMVRRLTVGNLPLNLDSGAIDATLDDMRWATRLFVVFPLWLDQPPDILCELFRQNVRRNTSADDRPLRMTVTMEMPAFIQRAMLQRGTSGPMPALALPGFRNARPDFIGSVDVITQEQRSGWLETVRNLGMHA